MYFFHGRLFSCPVRCLVWFLYCVCRYLVLLCEPECLGEELKSSRDAVDRVRCLRARRFCFVGCWLGSSPSLCSVTALQPCFFLRSHSTLARRGDVTSSLFLPYALREHTYSPVRSTFSSLVICSKPCMFFPSFPKHPDLQVTERSILELVVWRKFPHLRL